MARKLQQALRNWPVFSVLGKTRNEVEDGVNEYNKLITGVIRGGEGTEREVRPKTVHRRREGDMMGTYTAPSACASR